MTLLAAAGSYYYIESSVQRAPIMWDLRGSAFRAVGPYFSSQDATTWGNPFHIVSGDQHATLSVGFALMSLFLPDGSEYDLFGVSLDDGSTFGTTLAIYRSSGAYGLKVKRGSTVIADTGTGFFNTASRYYFEWKVILGTASNGSTEVYINEVQRATASSVTTSSSGTVWNAFAFHSMVYASMQISIDDIYVTNGAGSAPLNGILGDIVVAVIGPSVDTATKDWTASDDSTNHWKNLNYSLFDSRNLHDGTDGNREIFDTQAAPPDPASAVPPTETYTAGKTVYAVVAEVRAKVTDLPRKMSYGLRVGSDEDLTEIQLGTSYADFYHVHPQAPGSVDWTTTKLDSLQLVLQTGANT